MYARRKLLLDFALLLAFYSNFIVGACVAGPLTLFGRASDKEEPDRKFFFFVNMKIIQQLTTLLMISKASLYIVKTQAHADRIVQILEVMEEFQAHAGEKSSRIPDTVRRLDSSPCVTPQDGASVVLKNCFIYTPDGCRLLMGGVSLSLTDGESCLIMGASGIGTHGCLLDPGVGSGQAGRPNFRGLVLGCIDADCIDADFCRYILFLTTFWKALHEIYEIYALLHLRNPIEKP